MIERNMMVYSVGDVLGTIANIGGQGAWDFASMLTGLSEDTLYGMMTAQEKKAVRCFDTVLSGFRNGHIRIIPCPDGDDTHEPVAKIGEYWFYFIDGGAEDMTVEEYLSGTHDEDVAREIIGAMSGLSETERAYYIAYLCEHASAS